MIAPEQRLSAYLANLGPAAIAVSGGVDSMTLAVLGHRHNPGIGIFHAVSPAVPAQATQRVQRYAKSEGWRLHIIDAGEIEDPEYLANPANRCYFCKTNLYDTIVQNTSGLVLSGTNLDDLGDYRPGLTAAQEHQVCHPYVECQITKAMLRDIARSLALGDLQDLPAAPCLSSRIETGIRIDPQVLPIINQVEQLLWDRIPSHLDLTAVRCRVRSEGIVIELETAQSDPALNDVMDLIIGTAREAFSAAGFKDMTEAVRVEPYQRGSAFLIETLAVE
ncbi:MAG: hypothetical protein ACI9P7_002467 [Candidatus Azotimanducaceae bacterium]|jgi:uncharacterized protein